MAILYIENNTTVHYEIIESLLLKYRNLLGNIDVHQIVIHIPSLGSTVFKSYIRTKYPAVKFGKLSKYTYYIGVTLYPDDYKMVVNRNPSTHVYISHRIAPTVYNGAKNIFYLTPLSHYNVLSADILPYTEQRRQATHPIYIVQGSIERRDMGLLKVILEGAYTGRHTSYKIKILGKDAAIPPELQKYSERLIVCKNYNWEKYHKEFLDGYCILPLISKRMHPQYYTTTLTSTINYAKAYRLKCLIDRDLQEIYNLGDVEIFGDETDICAAFQRTLDDFGAPL